MALYAHKRRNEVMAVTSLEGHCLKDMLGWPHGEQNQATNSHAIKSKLLVLGAISTTINDQKCQHVTGRFESIGMSKNKSAGWPRCSVASLSKNFGVIQKTTVT